MGPPPPKPRERWPTPAVCPAAFPATASPCSQAPPGLPLLLSKSAAPLSNHPLIVSIHLEHPLTTSGAAVHPWEPRHPQLSLGGFLQGPSWEVRAPQGHRSCRSDQRPPRQRLPFQPRSLEIAACPRLDTLPERRQMKPVKLFLTFRAANF